jgi:hypothetical protein
MVDANFDDLDATLVLSWKRPSVGEWAATVMSRSAPASKSTCDVVVPLSQYDVGMRTRGDLRRQLRVDLPRSVVSVRGARARRPEDVLRHAMHPRLCTQAVLAPPLEWLILQGMVAHEVEGGSFPMSVDVDEWGLVAVTKTLSVRPWDHDVTSYCSPFFLTISVRAFTDTVVVSFTLETCS